ncbi:hypothetical protein OG21DRAFT_1525383 [Imleria badia]|nr:hypothetical protein OG21DRAFT_1525383 [Imleria badia]
MVLLHIPVLAVSVDPTIYACPNIDENIKAGGDCAPESCFCGRKTVESHEFWYCSTECARQDSLRSLGSSECHYRNVVRDAYARAGAPKRQLRRVASSFHLRPGPPDGRGFANAPPPFVPPTNLPHQGNVNRAAQDRNVPGFPTLSQVTGKVLSYKATVGKPLVVKRHERPRWEGFPDASSRARPVQRPGDHTVEQISLDATPFLDHVPARSLRRVPSFIDGLRNNARKSSLLNFGRSRKGKEGEDPERRFGHPVNPITPPVRKESLRSHRQMDPSSADPAQTSKALRRSASFAGWNATAHAGRGPCNEQDSLMHIIEEMREELGESFDPRSLFDQEEDK